ncbi:uncharacterized protein LOC126668667 [Mercurialis annua]|uniref:uncharacterized protein LOC126668667 n=1 Tax=Mercurialis annua TaxID=3986 RepID=UPI00215E7B0B|nr:uncharacterized protein LOC126668667 [Mercurialis annua]
MESLTHLFFSCPFAEVVWMGSPVYQTVVNVPNVSLMDFWLELDKTCSTSDIRNFVLSLVAWTLWSIWLCRNDLIFKDLFCDPLFVNHRAGPAISDQWSPPPRFAYKINFDGAFHNQSSSGVGAAVARNHVVKVIASSARRFLNVSSPALVEAMALREAIVLAKNLRLTDPIFEGDAKGIVDAMRSGSGVDRDCDVVIQDCRFLCRDFLLPSFNFIMRSFNWVAHIVAKKVLRDYFLL